MQFRSDNAASVHPAVWRALRVADTADAPYDDDAFTARLDSAFADLFGRPCVVLWAASGTAANCLALGAMVAPHGGVVCHRDAHIETSEGGAPGFFTYGAKLILAEGDGAKLTPASIAAVLPTAQGVHWTAPQAISITQANEWGLVYTPDEVAEIGAFARERGLRLHMDGARFANAVAVLECAPAALTCDAGVDALSFGMVKNGAMGAEALVLFDPTLADAARLQRKRAGHLQSKGRYLAAQLLAMVQDNVWIDNARAANAAAQTIATAAGERVLVPVETNQIFLRLSAAERAALRAQGFAFYDSGPDGARIVASWDSRREDCRAFARALSRL